jgi:hypothetical protein
MNGNVRRFRGPGPRLLGLGASQLDIIFSAATMGSTHQHLCQESDRDEHDKRRQRELAEQDGQGNPEMAVCSENSFHAPNLVCGWVRTPNEERQRRLNDERRK